jgi:hypothetical protein
MSAAMVSFDSKLAVVVVRRRLRALAKAQLELFNQQLAGSANIVTSIDPLAGHLGTVTVSVDIIGAPADPLSNNLLTALNKIVFNTWAIARNTAIPLSSAERTFGTYAGGGWITGGIPGRDSVHVLAQQNEFMVQAEATRALTSRYGAGVMDAINTGMLPERVSSNVIPFPVPLRVDGATSFDVGMVGELRAIKQELAAARKDNKELAFKLAEVIERGRLVQKVDALVGATKDQTTSMEADARHDRIHGRLMARRNAP